MRLNSLAMTPSMGRPTRFGQIWETGCGVFRGDADQFHAAYGISTSPQPPDPVTKVVTPAEAEGFLKSVVTNPLAAVERLVFEQVYRASIGLNRHDSVSWPAKQRSAFDQYQELPLGKRVSTLLGYWLKPMTVTVPAPARTSTYLGSKLD